MVERRTNRNGRGLNATVQTDLYVKDTTMTTQLQKIAAQKKIKLALESVIESSPNAAVNELSRSFRARSCSKESFVKRSSNNLLSSQLSLVSLEKDTQDTILKVAREEDDVIKRGEVVEKKIKEALGEGADVTVNVWNPWPWTEVLDKIAEHYGLIGELRRDNVEIFVQVFDKIDADGGGSIDQEEMYDALTDAGLDITEEGVLTLVAMIDRDGDGNIDRDEWRETVEFYLELKEEEKEMKKQQPDHADCRKEFRRKKLAELGMVKSVRARKPAARGDALRPVKETPNKVEEGMKDEDDNVGLCISSHDMLEMDIENQ